MRGGNPRKQKSVVSSTFVLWVLPKISGKKMLTGIISSLCPVRPPHSSYFRRLPSPIQSLLMSFTKCRNLFSAWITHRSLTNWVIKQIFTYCCITYWYKNDNYQKKPFKTCIAFDLIIAFIQMYSIPLLEGNFSYGGVAQIVERMLVYSSSKLSKC